MQNKNTFWTEIPPIYWTAFTDPDITYSVDIWEHMGRTTTNSIFIWQKRRITAQIVTNKHTIHLFRGPETLNLTDFKTVQMMYKGNNKMLPGKLQKMLQVRLNQYQLLY